MKRIFGCILIGLVGGFAGGFVVCAVIGQLYAEQLSVLVPKPVHEFALKTADWAQGYDEFSE